MTWWQHPGPGPSGAQLSLMLGEAGAAGPLPARAQFLPEQSEPASRPALVGHDAGVQTSRRSGPGERGLLNGRARALAASEGPAPPGAGGLSVGKWRWPGENQGSEVGEGVQGGRATPCY